MSKQEINVTIPCHGSTPAEQLSWVVRNFLCNVCESYIKGATRREQAYAIATNMIESANLIGDITEDECNSIHAEIQKIEDQIYPGCSLL